MTLVERHVPGSANEKKASCATFITVKQDCFAQTGSCHCFAQRAAVFCPKRKKKKGLGQDNPSLLPLDFAVLAEPKHQGLDVLLEDSHES